jgi:hypothetical protein
MAVLPKVIEYVNSLDDSLYVLEIKKHRKKRSKDANAYFWVLCDALAEKTHIAKSEIYKRLIKDIGGNSQLVCVPSDAVEKLTKGWEHNGLGWCVETFPSKLEGCTNVRLYYGSSTYDSSQMARLIDLIVQECKQQGIETLSPAELSLLTEGWKMK